jgi:hypothetical protein
MMCPVLSHLPCRNLDIPVLSQNLNPEHIDDAARPELRWLRLPA